MEILTEKQKNIFVLDDDNGEQVLTMNYMRSCPSPKHLFPETVRKPLKDLVSGVCPRTPSTKRISAMEFRVSTKVHTNYGTYFTYYRKSPIILFFKGKQC